ncbi:MAG: ribosome-associated translation inhibitor RaiA [Calothrix sp. SM1_5_4]|nr:ribosome-associated translation inhibitor RaiA [Calothrix sp. SM1_5_4]
MSASKLAPSPLRRVGMRIDFKFRHSPHSDELTGYVTERIGKLEKFEMKPVRVEFTFSSEKSCKRVDIHVRGEDIEMHAHSEADTFFEGVDHALEKIARQLARKKARVQAHKSPSKVS